MITYSYVVYYQYTYSLARLFVFPKLFFCVLIFKIIIYSFQLKNLNKSTLIR